MQKFSVLLLMGIWGCHQINKSNPVLNAEALPEITNIRFMDLKGQLIHLENYKGKQFLSISGPPGASHA